MLSLRHQCFGCQDGRSNRWERYWHDFFRRQPAVQVPSLVTSPRRQPTGCAELLLSYFSGSQYLRRQAFAHRMILIPCAPMLAPRLSRSGCHSRDLVSGCSLLTSASTTWSLRSVSSPVEETNVRMPWSMQMKACPLLLPKRLPCEPGLDRFAVLLPSWWAVHQFPQVLRLIQRYENFSRPMISMEREESGFKVRWKVQLHCLRGEESE